jgi:hypothetical protein
MAKKINKIEITQQGGIITINRNGEGPEWRMDANRYMDRIKEGKVTPEGMANYIAEIINDCLNCKTASAKLDDLDELGQYSDCTYFSSIDYLE